MQWGMVGMGVGNWELAGFIRVSGNEQLRSFL